jgi:hypothetical protein
MGACLVAVCTRIPHYAQNQRVTGEGNCANRRRVLSLPLNTSQLVRILLRHLDDPPKIIHNKRP